MKSKPALERRKARRNANKKDESVKKKYELRHPDIKSISRPTDLARELRVSVDRILHALMHEFPGKDFCSTSKLEEPQIEVITASINREMLPVDVLRAELTRQKSLIKPESTTPKKKRKKRKKKKKHDKAILISTPMGGQPRYRRK